LSLDELPEGVKSGLSLTTVAINTQIYLPYLQSQLLSLGATFVRKHLDHIREAFKVTSTPPSAVVNATGLLALKLGGVEDKKMYPTRGQTILVRNECSKMYFRSAQRLEEEPTYIIPRPFGGGTILGGCRQHRNWLINSHSVLIFRSGEVDPTLADRIALKCVALAPELTAGKGIEALDIVSHNVGLRPSRDGGPRLEREYMDGIGLIIHNYGMCPIQLVLIEGASGAGYQSSWGMAMRAAELLAQALSAPWGKGNL
jgi:D-amino-acid oxidase